MVLKRINLRDDGSAYLVIYLRDHYEEKWENVGEWQPEKRPVMIICPGGGYAYCSAREAEPIVYPFLNEGFQVSVLYYSVGDDSVFPRPLEDISLAVSEVRKHADEWGIFEDKVAVCGFSAGGNLCAMLGTQWDNDKILSGLEIPKGQSKPNALILGYAVAKPIDDVSNTSVGAMIKKQPDEIDICKYVNENTPPMFIWHTMEDEKVSVLNSILLAEACEKNKVPFELHIFGHGCHGLALNTDSTAYGLEHPINAEKWVKLCINWVKKLFEF